MYTPPSSYASGESPPASPQVTMPTVGSFVSIGWLESEVPQIRYYEVVGIDGPRITARTSRGGCVFTHREGDLWTDAKNGATYSIKQSLIPPSAVVSRSTHTILERSKQRVSMPALGIEVSLKCGILNSQQGCWMVEEIVPSIPLLRGVIYATLGTDEQNNAVIRFHYENGGSTTEYTYVSQKPD